MNDGIIILTGNGFNYLMKNIVLKMDSDFVDTKDIAAKIEEITVLWDKFSDLFKDLKRQYPLNEEELIRIVYVVLDFLANINQIRKLLKKTGTHLKAITDELEDIIIQKIMHIAEEFTMHEKNNEYKKLKALFPDFGKQFFNIMSQKDISTIHIFTTNYDGIIDTLLTDYGAFLFGDGFCIKQDRRLGFSEDTFKALNDLCLHLHGSYKFEEDWGYTYKLIKGQYNNNPSMIFNNPDHKEDWIRQDNVLSMYYQKFIDDLKTFNKLLIIGNSLNSDPHIVRQITNHFNKSGNKIFIFDINTQAVKEKLSKSQKGVKYAIHEINTSSIDTIDGLLSKINTIL